MSGLLKPPSARCDDAAPDGESTQSVAPEGSPAAPGGAPFDAPEAVTPNDAAASHVVESADAPWNRLVAAARAAKVPTLRLAPEHAIVLAGRGVEAKTLRRLLYGYPALPLSVGRLTFFPPLAELEGARRVPELFYAADAWKGEHVFRRRLRAALTDLEEPLDFDADALRGPLLDEVLVGAAANYLESIGTQRAVAEDGNFRFWLPGAEEVLVEHAGSADARAAFALFGPLSSWEDFYAELERRLMVARLWTLLGLGAALLALATSGALSSRLLLAFGAFGILGGGLGIGPWMRSTKRQEELLSARVARPSKDSPLSAQES